MIEINLLPWRDMKRKEEQRVFTYVLWSLFLGVMSIMILSKGIVTQFIAKQSNFNQQLQKEITLFDKQLNEIKQIKDTQKILLSRITKLQKLQTARTMTIHLFDELVNVMPSGVYLIRVQRIGSRVILFGYAESNNQISRLMRRINKNPWIQNARLTEIKQNKGATIRSGNEFELNFVLKS